MNLELHLSAWMLSCFFDTSFLNLSELRVLPVCPVGIVSALDRARSRGSFSSCSSCSYRCAISEPAGTWSECIGSPGGMLWSVKGKPKRNSSLVGMRVTPSDPSMAGLSISSPWHPSLIFPSPKKSILITCRALFIYLFILIWVPGEEQEGICGSCDLVPVWSPKSCPSHWALSWLDPRPWWAFDFWHLRKLLAKMALVPSVVPISTHILAGYSAGADCARPHGNCHCWHGALHQSCCLVPLKHLSAFAFRWVKCRSQRKQQSHLGSH